MRIVFVAMLTLLSTMLFGHTQEFTLSNGLKILVKEDHRAPIVVSMVWYHVGSADEPGGLTGVSHVLEHLMFKGTAKNPLGVFSKKIAAIGGQENAFTSNDYTAFFEKTAARDLAINLELEADRMQGLLLDEQEFAKEMKVIQEERRMRTDDNPQALAFERFIATAHLSEAYHHPVIGWMSDLKNMTVQDAKQWYQTYYAPNNATLVVVGDVQANEVYLLAKKYFGHLEKRTVPDKKRLVEPDSLGEKKVVVRTHTQLPMLILGYAVPSVATTQRDPFVPYALDVIASILDNGDSGRLGKSLIHGQEIAANASTYYNPYSRYSTQFVIFGSPSQRHTLADLKAALLAEVSRLQSTQVSENELARIKTQIITQKTFEKDSIFSQAMEIGLLESVGLGWKTSEQYIHQIKHITPEQIQKTAQRYFQDSALTEMQLLPK